MSQFINFSSLNQVIFFIGISSIFFSLLLIIFILLFRIVAIKKKYEIMKFYKTWNPIFNNINFSIPNTLPKIKESNQFHLLKIFNKTYEKTSFNSQMNLLSIANYLDIEDIARNMLDYKNSIYKIVALKTIGYLQIEKYSSKLDDLIEHENIVITLIAVQSLIKISSKDLDKLISLLIEKEECHINKIILILSNLNKEVLLKSIKNLINTTNIELLPRLIKLFDLIEKKDANEEAKKLLLKYQEIEIISTAILFISDDKEKKFLFSFVEHPSWIIRMQAIKALSNMLCIEDIKNISKLLLDSSWWVRYHTAYTIVSIKSITNNYLDNLEEVLGDKFAIDALKVARKKKDLFDSI